MPVEVAITIGLFVVTAALSLAKGGLPEQIAGIGLVVWLLVARLIHVFAGPGFFSGPAAFYIVLDSLAFILLFTLALFANRLWPTFATALQLIPLLGHMAVHLVLPGTMRAYWAMTQLPPLLMALTVILGTLMHWRRVRRVGSYRDWRLTTR